MSAGEGARSTLREVRTTILLGEAALCDEVLTVLLARRPSGQVWSVLDNRPDGAVAGPGSPGAAATGDAPQPIITYLAGGCLCCAGVNLRVTLTRLLRAQRPQRLFILPPPEAVLRELLRQLTDTWLLPVLDVRAVVGLLDAVHWSALPATQRRERLLWLAQSDVLAVAGDPLATPCADEWQRWLGERPALRPVRLLERTLAPEWLDQSVPPRGGSFRKD